MIIYKKNYSKLFNDHVAFEKEKYTANMLY